MSDWSDWQLELYKTHPNLFLKPVPIECNDGWKDLIWELCDKLEQLIIQQTGKELPFESYCYATQIKEKYGTLHFYMSSQTQEMADLIDEAEKKSAETCEQCGKPGRILANQKWLCTLCEKCAMNIKKDP